MLPAGIPQHPLDVRVLQAQTLREPVVIADGIELHVREDSPAARASTMVAIREAVRAALGREAVR